MINYQPQEVSADTAMYRELKHLDTELGHVIF